MKSFLKNGFLHFCILFMSFIAAAVLLLLLISLRMLWDFAYGKWWIFFKLYGMHLFSFVVFLVAFYINFHRKLMATSDDRPE